MIFRPEGNFTNRPTRISFNVPSITSSEHAEPLHFIFSEHKTPDELYTALRNLFVKANGEETGTLLDNAYKLAKEHHDKAPNKIRDDGRDYIFHPLEISYHIARLGFTDKVIILAALFHDLLEDTEVSKEEIVERLGKKLISKEEFDLVMKIVNDLTEDTSYRKQNLEYKEDSQSKFKLADGETCKGRLATKIEHLSRVANKGIEQSTILKVVDRIHNLLTNEAVSIEKQRRMEVKEIEAWRKFLDLRREVIPESLITLITPLLDKEYKVI